MSLLVFLKRAGMLLLIGGFLGKAMLGAKTDCECADIPVGLNTSLFAEEEILEITLATNLKALLKDRKEERSYHEAELTFAEGGKTIQMPVKTKIRGNFRRKNCKFPPIRIKVDSASAVGTMFEGMDKLKLVTHCQNKKEQYEQYILQEYLSYKTFNHLTDNSFRVRLLKITYEDSSGKLDPMTRYAFFIEPEEIMAQRLGGEVRETMNVHPKQTAEFSGDIVALFSYMIGNTDWSIAKLHNVKMLHIPGKSAPIPVPYDFDWCGLINAPYAFPNPQLGIGSVKERVYRGFCIDEADFQQLFTHFQAKKADIYAEFNECEQLSPKVRERSLEYLDEFFDLLDRPKGVQRAILDACRTNR
jgi:hypothetical protein